MFAPDLVRLAKNCVFSHILSSIVVITIIFLREVLLFLAADFLQLGIILLVALEVIETIGVQINLGGGGEGA